jgi:hypothetical protein
MTSPIVPEAAIMRGRSLKPATHEENCQLAQYRRRIPLVPDARGSDSGQYGLRLKMVRHVEDIHDQKMAEEEIIRLAAESDRQKRWNKERLIKPGLAPDDHGKHKKNVQPQGACPGFVSASKVCLRK